ETSVTSALPPIVPVPRDVDLPLSFAQQRLWFFDRLMPGGALYNIAAVWRLSGALEIGVLAGSLVEIARRHEILRTRFPAWQDGLPRQLILAEPKLEMPRVELAGLDESVKLAELHRLAKEEAARSFDLARGPVLRASLVSLGALEYALLLTVHHIVFDGWSSGLLRHELAALYNACQRGEPSPLPALPLQYVDYALWQRSWLQGEILEAQLAYWKARLGGRLPILALPLDRPRPPVQTFRGAKVRIDLPLPLGEALK